MADLVGAVLWPALVAFLLWVYKPEVVGMLRRLRLLTTEPGSTEDIASRLERIAKLKADGVLTEEEFQVQKQRLLSGQ
ncbi:MAG: SHOCT domain-containing protein [Candidatus Limnocylindria bacterium]